MNEALFSRSWYRVADLRPKLRAHARVHRHRYRDVAWIILEDIASQRIHRFTPETYEILGRMDGEATVGEIWESLLDLQGDDAPTQDELIALLTQLHQADLLASDVPPDTKELLERSEKQRKSKQRSRWMSPLSIQVPLFDPDRWLARLDRQCGRLLGPIGAALGLLIVGSAAVRALIHGEALAEGGLAPILAPENLLLIWLAFPVIKALHEIGHGLIAKRFGIEIHEMGLMLLVFTPVPYVDASSASALPDKRQRALISAGGMIIEILLASVALHVWLAVEPGLVRTLAYNTILIAGVTTLFFNANPLLRFDGYYILADWLEIPNLRQRANDLVSALFETHVLRLDDAVPPDRLTPGEPAWLIGFAVTSFVYRLFVMAFIFLYVLDVSLVIGVVLIAVTLVTWVGRPLVKAVRFLRSNPRLHGRRRATVTAVAASFCVGLLVLFALPVPYRTGAEGIVWLPDEALVRAGSDGVISEVLSTPGSRVEPGTPLVQCRDVGIEAELDIARARLRDLRVRYRRARTQNPTEAQILAEHTLHAERELARAQERVDGLLIHSETAGTFILPRARHLEGRHVSRGQLLAYVVEPDEMHIRAVVAQSAIDLVRDQDVQASVRLAEDRETTHGAVVSRIHPSARTALPSSALGTTGGGKIPIDPESEDPGQAATPMFEVELVLDNPPRDFRMGGRAYIRFDHGSAPLAYRWARELRQLFLATLDV